MIIYLTTSSVQSWIQGWLPLFTLIVGTLGTLGGIYLGSVLSSRWESKKGRINKLENLIFLSRQVSEEIHQELVDRVYELKFPEFKHIETSLMALEKICLLTFPSLKDNFQNIFNKIAEIRQLAVRGQHDILGLKVKYGESYSQRNEYLDITGALNKKYNLKYKELIKLCTSLRTFAENEYQKIITPSLWKRGTQKIQAFRKPD